MSGGKTGVIRGVLLLLLATTAQASQAQETKAWKQQIKSAYDKSKAASTVEEFSEVILLCQKANQAKVSAQAKEYLEQLLSWVHNRRGELYVEQAAKLQEAAEAGDFPEAAPLDQRALADFEAAVGYAPSSWKPLHNRGVSVALQGDFEQAISDFSRVIELKPGYANGWFNRGEIRFELGQFEDAVKDYTQALELDATDTGALNSRGLAFEELGENRKALKDFTKAIQLDPDLAAAHANRAEIHRKLELWAKSAADYRQAISRGANTVKVFQGMAWLMATCPDAQYRDSELAIKAAERAIELSDEPDPACLDALAAALANAGRYQEARAKMAEAIELAATSSLPVMQKRLGLYQKDLPFRDSATATARVEEASEVR